MLDRDARVRLMNGSVSVIFDREWPTSHPWVRCFSLSVILNAGLFQTSLNVPDHDGDLHFLIDNVLINNYFERSSK